MKTKTEVRSQKPEARSWRFAWLLTLVFGLWTLDCEAFDYSTVQVNTNSRVAAPPNFWAAATNDPNFTGTVSHLYDPAGAAQAATNGYPWGSLYDVSGAGTTAAQAATNGFPWGSLYDPANAAHNATNGYPWGSLYDAAGAAQAATNAGNILFTNQLPGLTNGFVTASITNGFNQYGFSTPKYIGTTNYTMVSGDHDIYGSGTNQLLTLLTNAAAGHFVLVGLTNANGSIILTNPIGWVIQGGVTSRTLTNGQHAFLRNISGTHWW